MKFSRLSTALVLLASSAAVSATSTVTVTSYAAGATPTTASECTSNTGALECCAISGAANSLAIIPALGVANVVVQPVTAIVGAVCTTLAGVGSSCSAQAVCCQNNNFNGLVVIGCNPVDLTL